MTIPLVKVPKFTATLPVSEKSFNFRPFLVKEEKILLLANESNDAKTIIKTIGDIVEECTFGEVTVENHCLADLQYAYLQIRGKSIGEDFSFYKVCGDCGHKHLENLNIDDFDVSGEKRETLIVLEDGTKIQLKYPNLNHYSILFDEDNDDKIFDVIAECIVKVYNDEEVFEATSENKKDILEFIENLTSSQFKNFESFFSKMPVLYKKIDFVCENCNAENSLLVDSVTNFFD